MDEVVRKVGHTHLFQEGSEPSNPAAWGIPLDKHGHILDPAKMSTEQKLALDHVLTRMDIHRALLRGNGFYEVLVPQIPEATVEAIGAQLQDLNLLEQMKELPRTNFLDIEDKEYAECIVQEALPHDRDRFRAYLSDRPLDLGLISSVSD